MMASFSRHSVSFADEMHSRSDPFVGLAWVRTGSHVGPRGRQHDEPRRRFDEAHRAFADLLSTICQDSLLQFFYRATVPAGELK
jgi:hypothetical protein